MSFISLDKAKMHLRVDTSHDDELIVSIIQAAEAHISDYLNRPVPWMTEDEEEEPEEVPVPASVIHAGLLIIGDLYEHREQSIIGSIRSENPAVYRLLDPYRRKLGV